MQVVKFCTSKAGLLDICNKGVRFCSLCPNINRCQSSLAELRQYSDVASLKSALHQLCSEFGRITRLDILTAMHEGTKQAICFLRMERPEQEQVLMKSLGVGRFGGEVVFVLNLNMPVTAEEGPSSQWADSDIY